MVHVVPGLEALAWEELAEIDGRVTRVATWTGFDDRAGVLLFRYGGPVSSLLRLRMADDLFSVIGIEDELPLAKRGTAALSKLALEGDGIDAALHHQLEAGSGKRRARPTFRVVARRTGRHVFRRVDAQRACEAGIAKRFHRWRLAKDKTDLEFWIQIVDTEAVLALRLTPPDTRSQALPDVSLPAALKPAVAHALVRLARVRRGRFLLDPMCGAGSVLGAAAARGMRPVGGDSSPEAVAVAQRNLHDTAALARWDATHLPISDRAIDGIACNLPSGKQHQHDDLEQFYRRFFAEAQRVNRNRRRISILTSERVLLERLIKRDAGLEIEQSFPVVIRGAKAFLYALRMQA